MAVGVVADGTMREGVVFLVEALVPRLGGVAGPADERLGERGVPGSMLSQRSWTSSTASIGMPCTSAAMGTTHECTARMAATTA